MTRRPGRGRRAAPDRWTLLWQLVAIALAFTMASGVAWGYWTAGSGSGGNGASAAAGVNQGATPTATVAGHAVTVSWAATTLTNGQAVSGYTVKRYSGSTVQTLLTACTGTIAGTSCIENSVPLGTWTYSVTPLFATNWQGIESAKSGAVTVINGAPSAVANSYSVNEDVTLNVAASGVLTNDTDPEGDPLTAIVASGVANGTLTLNSNGGFTYTPNPNFNGSDSFTYKANDGALDSNAVTVTITVTAVNDRPLNAVPGGQQTPKNTSRVFSNANNNLISISDLDAGGATVQVQLTATNGTVTLPVLTNLSFSVGDGTADATMTFTGTIANINLRLSGATFIPTNSFTGAATLQIVTNDQGNTGSGGALTDTDSVTLNVGSSNLGIFTANADIGSPSFPGSSSYAASTGTYTVVGGGADIFATDQFQYLYTPITANGRLTVHVVSSTSASAAGKAGVMFRATGTNNTAVQAMMDIMKTAGSEFQWRTTAGTSSQVTGVSTGGIAAPYWERITRIGTDYTGERSSDGVTWTTEDATRPVTSLTGTINIGLAVTAHDNTKLSTVVYDNVSLNVTAPTAAGDSYSVNEDTTLNVAASGVLANDSDPESDTLTAVLVSGTTGLTLNANGSFTYVPPANFNGTASFTYKANDGVFDSNTVTVNLIVAPAQETPSFTKGANQSVAGNAGAQTAAGWATSISQGAGEAGQLVDFIVTNTNNALFSVQPAVSAAGTLTYTPAGTTGVATVSVRIHDNGGTANGAVDTSAVQTFTITVAAAPVVTASGSSLAYTENNTTVLDSGITVTDAGSTNLTSATVTMTTGHVIAEDTLAFTNQNGITGTWNAGTGVLALSGTTTVANYQTALQSITYNNSSDNPTTTTRTVTFLANDGSFNSNIASRTITITAVNDAPVVAATGSSLAYTENASPLLDSGITVTDADSTNLTSATVTMTTNHVTAEDTLAFTNQNGITGIWTAGTGVLALSGTTTVANYQTALRSIIYNDNSDNPTTTTRTVTFLANDGGLNSNTASRTITVTSVNDAPVNTVPGAQTTAMGVAKVFSLGNSNLISIGDLDAGSSQVKVQLVSTNGTTTLSVTSGLTFSGGGNGQATMTFTGTISNINVALGGLSFAPTGAFTGAASLQIITNDQGFTGGSGGPLTDSDTVAITVT
jgi:hypothetical protein